MSHLSALSGMVSLAIEGPRMPTIDLLRLHPHGSRPPRRVRERIQRLGRLVAVATAAPPSADVATDQPCTTPGCPGAVWARHRTRAVQWWCNHCGHTGEIVGWRGGRWDRGAAGRVAAR